MRAAALLGIAGLALAACQDPTAPEPATATVSTPDFAVGQRPENRCNGEIIAGIARTWPFAHEDHESFAPPKGAIAKWLDEIGGPVFGITSVRELQLMFCEVPI